MKSDKEAVAAAEARPETLLWSVVVDSQGWPNWLRKGQRAGIPLLLAVALIRGEAKVVSIHRTWPGREL